MFRRGDVLVDRRTSAKLLPRRPVLLVVAGEGGHLEQAKRFSVLAAAEEVDPIIVTEATLQGPSTDYQTIYRWNISRWTKTRGLAARISTFVLAIAEFFRAPLLLRKYRPIGIVAFGPLFCVPLAIAARLLGYKIVFVETWSKFQSKTKTGAILEGVVNRVYVQNRSLMAAFKNSKYAGRL